MDDPEIKCIGQIIAAVEFGKANGLDRQAWRRIFDYSESLIGAECSRGDVGASKPMPAPKVAVIKKRRMDTWHVLGRRTKNTPLPPWKLRPSP